MSNQIPLPWLWGACKPGAHEPIRYHPATPGQPLGNPAISRLARGRAASLPLPVQCVFDYMRLGYMTPSFIEVQPIDIDSFLH